MHIRPSNMAAAFINAAIKTTKTEKVNHAKGTGNWIARRAFLNCERPVFAEVREFDRSPPKPATAKKALDVATVNAINTGIEEVVELCHAAKAAGLDESQVFANYGEARNGELS